MGLIPGYEHDIFVSFAHADDLDVSPDHPEAGWVGATVKRLSNILQKSLKPEIERTGRELDIFWSHRVEKDRPLNTSLHHHVDGSALLLVIMSDHFLRSDWCIEKETAASPKRWARDAAHRPKSTIRSICGQYLLCLSGRLIGKNGRRS